MLLKDFLIGALDSKRAIIVAQNLHPTIVEARLKKMDQYRIITAFEYNEEPVGKFHSSVLAALERTLPRPKTRRARSETKILSEINTMAAKKPSFVLLKRFRSYMVRTIVRLIACQHLGIIMLTDTMFNSELKALPLGSFRVFLSIFIPIEEPTTRRIPDKALADLQLGRIGLVALYSILRAAKTMPPSGRDELTLWRVFEELDRCSDEIPLARLLVDRVSLMPFFQLDSLGVIELIKRKSSHKFSWKVEVFDFMHESPSLETHLLSVISEFGEPTAQEVEFFHKQTGLAPAY